MSQETPLLAQAIHDLDIARIALYFARQKALGSEETFARRLHAWKEANCPEVDLTDPVVSYDVGLARRELIGRRKRRVKQWEADVRALFEMVERLKQEREGVEAEPREDGGVL